MLSQSAGRISQRRKRYIIGHLPSRWLFFSLVNAMIISADSLDSLKLMKCSNRLSTNLLSLEISADWLDAADGFRKHERSISHIPVISWHNYWWDRRSRLSYVNITWVFFGLVIHNVRWDILNGRWTHMSPFKKCRPMRNIEPIKRKLAGANPSAHWN